jgi:hypothetical protein
MYKLNFYVPKKYSSIVKDAIFQTGAGSIGNYSHCSFETLGTGQFKPLPGANPTLGELGAIEVVEELKVEILCEEKNIKEAIKAMKMVHPYEEVAYEVLSVLNYSL